MKYVISEYKEVLIFPDTLNHADMARRLERKAVSAGFIHLHDGEVICSGESYTLSLKSRGTEDAEIVQRALAYY